MKKKTNKITLPIRLSATEKIIYIVDFVNPIDNDHDQYIMIGIFSSETKAKEAINTLLLKPGFINYTKENFIVGPTLVDQMAWNSGFTTIKY